MRITARAVLTALLFAALWTLGVLAAEGPAKLPGSISEYRSWKMMAEASSVPLDTWALCRPAPANWDRRVHEKHGPHAKRYIRVYGNALAASALARSVQHLPVGAIIVKEKLLTADQDAPDAVAFMIKRSEKEFPESGGWEFRYFPSNEQRARTTQQSCTKCHRAAKESDYIVGTYKSE